MRTRLANGIIAAAIGAAALSVPDAARAQLEVELTVDIVEPPARAAARAAAPGVVFDEASMEIDEDGHHSIEISGRAPDGGRVEVDLHQEGDTWIVDEVERDVSWSDTPAAVKAALARLFLDDWRPSLIERSERPGGRIVYEIEGVDAAGDTIELEIARSGEIITINKDTAT